MRSATPASRPHTARALLAAVVTTLALSLPSVAVAAAQSEVKTNPPLGGSYDAFNVPTPPD